MGASIAGLIGPFALGVMGAAASAWLMPVMRRRAEALRVRLGGQYSVPIQPRRGTALLAGCFFGLLCGQAFGSTLQAVAALCLSLSLVALAWVDLDTRLLPDFLTLPLLGAGLAANVGGVFVAWPQALAGAAIGYGGLWVLAMLYRWWRGKEGLGGGDLKCVAAMGSWLGWQALPLLLLLAALLALAAGGLSMAFGRRSSQPQAFGPWLAASGLVMLFAVSGGVAPPLP